MLLFVSTPIMFSHTCVSSWTARGRKRKPPRWENTTTHSFYLVFPGGDSVSPPGTGCFDLITILTSTLSHVLVWKEQVHWETQSIWKRRPRFYHCKVWQHAYIGKRINPKKNIMLHTIFLHWQIIISCSSRRIVRTLKRTAQTPRRQNSAIAGHTL